MRVPCHISRRIGQIAYLSTLHDYVGIWLTRLEEDPYDLNLLVECYLIAGLHLSDDQKERLSTLVQWNMPIVRAYYLKEAFQLFWFYRQPKRASDHLEKWMRSAMRSRLEPFKKFVRMLRGHLGGILSWTKSRVSNGAVEAMNNKIKSISHRSFGFRPAQNCMPATYHSCRPLPRPVERDFHFSHTYPC